MSCGRECKKKENKMGVRIGNGNARKNSNSRKATLMLNE
jgi:hypothetical protein